MKIDFKRGIILAFIGFIVFIMVMVVKMSINKKYDHDLVTESYYQKELAYQTTINARANAAKLESQINIRKIIGKGLKIEFPSNFIPSNIKGKVFLYRPSNKQLDFEIPISIANSYLLVPEHNLLDGRWNITVFFEYEGEQFILQKEIIY